LRGIGEFFDQIETQGKTPKAGRSWTASELRLKSFDDLHKLWFVLVKERNLLLTERERADKRTKNYSLISGKIGKVKVSMARLKTGLGERERYADYIDYVKNNEEEKKKKQIVNAERQKPRSPVKPNTNSSQTEIVTK